MFERFLPMWAHPRSPLVAISSRRTSIWDYRFNRYASGVLSHLARVWLILVFFLPILFLFAVAVDPQFFALLSYAVLAAFSPLLLIPTEILLTRLWLTLPSRTSDMIAGEKQRQTWDILLSTPFTRHNLVFSKLAALWWMSRPSLIYILVMRVFFLGGLLIVRVFEDNSPVGGNGLGWFLWTATLIVMPLLELYALAGVGLFISASIDHIGQARLIATISQFLYRMLSVWLLLAIGGRVSFMTLVFFVPQWALMPLWEGVSYSLALVAGLVVAGVALPLLVGTLALLLTMTRLQT